MRTPSSKKAIAAAGKFKPKSERVLPLSVLPLLSAIPELNTAGLQLLRIPAEVDVPVTPRVLQVLDTPAMQRLRRISQLGLVSYVYPGAVHTRFEHSLGVYRLACLTIRHLLANEEALAANTTVDDVKVFLLAALLHDIGHWPYCHAIEDLRLAEFPRHEELARTLICGSPMAAVIEREWSVEPAQVAELIASTRAADADSSVLRSLLSGPVDIDKLDYLQRDSLHAGVPYGRNFDVNRLVSSLCVAQDGKSLAITEKGKTAAEMMVFARYVMFSEVYWHHTVRSATAMLQRLVYDLRDTLPSQQWLCLTENDFGNRLLANASNQPAAQQLADGLFGHQRGLYKRLAQYTLSDAPHVFAAVARRPYAELVELSGRLAQQLSLHLSRPLAAHDVLIDAPPVKLEVQFNIDVRQAARHTASDVSSGTRAEFRRTPSEAVANDSAHYVQLSHISPVVRALATEQFDNFVKRVRIFVAPERAYELSLTPDRVTQALLSVTADVL